MAKHRNKPVDLKNCKRCFVTPRLKCVGDWKTLIVMYCPSCGKTVALNKGRLTARGAIKEWNKMIESWVT